ncbi:uncharacterized protein LOC131942906 [Physella acuta]|uniref:uncharacterized protein LOC131942906 n=1 Tax=Physella acuta TaxID=109671 RepID=UPI0027DC7F42|nr:uncharacterized protein LOC131942906 [Physella acuta]
MTLDTEVLYDDQGLCLAGSSCERGWFGPLCQYQDLATVGAKLTPSNSLIDDGDDDTCSNLKTVTITWDTAYIITWLRLSLNDTGVFSNTNITIKLTNVTGADTGITYFSMIPVTSRVKDILLCSSLRAIKVTLTFLRAVTVCSLNINGGRNVALHQKTWQSTNYNESGVIYDSSKAVDGNNSNDFYGQGSCSHTLGVNGRWGINLTREHRVDRFVLYNRGDYQQRLRGFNLVAYNKNNQLQLNYTDDSKLNVSVYNITTTAIYVQSVNITVRTYLTLCEVEIFGDIECDSARLGLECTNTCNCNDPTETCFVATGGCRSGCTAGYQGEGCSKGW